MRKLKFFIRYKEFLYYQYICKKYDEVTIVLIMGSMLFVYQFIMKYNKKTVIVDMCFDVVCNACICCQKKEPL